MRDDEFTMTTAGVVCGEMGFGCALFFNSGEKWNAVQSEYSVILESVVCEEGEDTTFSSNCTYNTDNDCAHNEDIFLFCDKGNNSNLGISEIVCAAWLEIFYG